jgi:hypothetical protein
MANQYRNFDPIELRKIINMIKDQIGAHHVNTLTSRADALLRGITARNYRSPEVRRLEARIRMLEDLIERKKEENPNLMYNGGRKRVTRRKKSIRKKR